MRPDAVLVAPSPWLGEERGRLADAMKRAGWICREREGMPPKLDCDLLVVLGPHHYGPPPRGSAKKIGWWTEQPGAPAALKRAAIVRDRYDAMFSLDEKFAAENGFEFLPPWCDPDCPEPLWDAERPIELLFYGTFTPRRSAIMENVRKVLPFEFPHAGVWGEKRRAAISLSKVVIVPHAWDGPSFEPIRLFQIAEGGALALMETAPSTAPFDPKEHYATFGSDTAGIFARVALDHFEETIDRRKALWKKTREFTPDRALETLLSTCPAA